MERIIEINSDSDKKLMDQIVNYEKNVFGEGSIGKWNISPFAKYGKIFVLMNNDDIVSVAEVLNSFDDVTAYIYGFFTVEKYRGMGKGSKLLSYVSDYLEKKGKRKVELTVQVNNENAIKLYKKHKFMVEKILPDEYGDGNERFLMIKKI